jgi:hypothetical protein
VDGQVRFSQILLFLINISFQIAWTMAAVGGTRVLGAIPIVLDMVNLQQVKREYSCKIKSIFLL